MERLSFLPEQDGYGVAFPSATFREQLHGPLGRYGQAQKHGTFNATCTWKLDSDEYQQFWRFYERHYRGTIQFLIELITNSPHPVDHTAAFVANSFTFQEQRGDLYVVRCDLECIPNA